MENSNKILVVEDDRIMREILSIFLTEYGNIVSVSCGEEAIIECKSGVFDLVLMDIKSNNGKDGIETFKIIRDIEKYKDIPVVAITGCAMNGDKERILNEGFNGYLAKPFIKKVFIDFVKKYLP